MKRKASTAFTEEEDLSGEPRPRLDDCFVAEEILPRLPAHVAHAFSTASSFFHGVLTDPDYWLSPRRHSHAPTPRAAACLVVRASDDGERLLHEFHYADGDFSAEPAVARAAGGSLAAYRYAGTCNGLVLLAAPWSNHTSATGVIFNPTTGDEETFTVAALDDDTTTAGGRRMFHCFCGFGYSQSSKAYKALLCCTPGSSGGGPELLVVPIGGAAARRREKPRRLAAIDLGFAGGVPIPSSLTLDGKVYALGDISARLLAVDIDDDTVTVIKRPPGGWPMSPVMEVWGRPCVATGDGRGRSRTMLWTLTPDYQWELRCLFATIVPTSPPRRERMAGAADDAMVHGVWDCGDGVVFVLFLDGRGCRYEYGPAAVAREVVDGGGAHNLVPLPVELQKVTFCWGYQPTLIPPATTVAGAAACASGECDGSRCLSSGTSRRPCKSGNVERRRRCLEELMAEMMRKPADTARREAS